MQKSLILLSGGLFGLFLMSAAQAMTPLEECMPSSVPVACLDAKLREANVQLNAALKAATQHIEELEKKGERPVMNGFVNSQRQFNSYRDANCAWQAIRIPQADKTAFVKDCQIRATLAREQELLAFAAGESGVSPLPPGQGEQSNPQTPSAEQSASAETASKQTESAPGQSTVQTGHDSVETVTVQPSVVAPPVVTPPVTRAEAAPVGNAAPARRSGIEWLLKSWVVNGVEKPLVPASQITVSFDPSGKVAGNASVNRFSGEYRFDEDGHMVWSGAGFALTRMAGPPALMKQEQAFMQTLRQMTDFHTKSGQLILENAKGRTALTFARK